MGHGKLESLTLARFKSYSVETNIDLAPLTVVLGRNNSGKSSIIQALLLLKQTLALPRPDVPLHLEGIVDALSLREITSGWPAAADRFEGPEFELRWSSTVSMREFSSVAHRPDYNALAEVGVPWALQVAAGAAEKRVATALRLSFAEIQNHTVLQRLQLVSFDPDAPVPGRPIHRLLVLRGTDARHTVFWSGDKATKLDLELDHFLPFLIINRRTLGPRDRQRSWHNAFLLLYSQPLEDLRYLLARFAYLGSSRTLPATLYRPATVPPEDVGISGEYAAQMLHARRTEAIHYLPPISLAGGEIQVPNEIRARTLETAVNDVLRDLSIDTPLTIEDVRDVGFRLLFGRASLQHVGRGLSYLLPVIQLGLVADPLRFETSVGDVTIDDYLRACPSYAHCAFEEPEAHLHPKVQARLAHWFVSLALAGRRLIVETHSDHLVRRLRGLVARAGANSSFERWLLHNVRVLEVEQRDGQSTVRQSRLTPEGSLAENWPADFMDEATEEERTIYNASLDKQPMVAPEWPIEAIHDVGEEPDTSE